MYFFSVISDFYCRISMNIDKPMIKEPTIPERRMGAQQGNPEKI